MENILDQAGVIAAITGIVSFIVGLLFIFNVGLLEKLSQALNKKLFCPEDVQRGLDKEIEADTWLVNHGRVIGALLIMATIAIFFQTWQNPASSLVITAGVGFAAIGLIFVVNPRFLGALSQALNKKLFCPEDVQNVLDKEKDIDKWLLSNNKLMGAVFIILALVITATRIVWR